MPHLGSAKDLVFKPAQHVECLLTRPLLLPSFNAALDNLDNKRATSHCRCQQWGGEDCTDGQKATYREGSPFLEPPPERSPFVALPFFLKCM